jgi:hypothetical protein
MLGRPALSFEANKTFKALVERSINAKSITILCGAGVSIGAGLPTWRGLINEIARRRASEGDKLAELVPTTEVDLLRAAGLLIRGRDVGHREPDYATISAALYAENRGFTASYLPQQIARFAGSQATRIAIATTNLDDVVELALKKVTFDVISCSLQTRLEEWWQGFEAPDPAVFHVLHLHGYLARDDNSAPLLPLILTEDSFRKHGADVQAEIAKIIERSELVLGLGLSLTDPNLIGPLTESEDNAHVFLTNVAGRLEGATPDQAEELALERGRYLSDLFGIEVVSLNSYGQLSQLMMELELAMSHPNAYLSDSSRHCARYGYRLSRTLKRAYPLIGWPADRDEPYEHSLEKASDSLFGLLQELRPRLTELVLDHNDRDLRALGKVLNAGSRDLESHLEGEGLALFLWLPTHFRPHEKVQRHYRLQLVGSSAYTHRDYWSFRREPVEVNAYARSSQAKAAFTGQPLVEPADREFEPRLWKTNVAIPLTVVTPDGESSVACGSIVLTSDRSLLPDPASSEDHSSPSRAAVSYLGTSLTAEYCRLIAEQAANFLGGQPPGLD